MTSKVKRIRELSQRIWRNKTAKIAEVNCMSSLMIFCLWNKSLILNLLEWNPQLAQVVQRIEMEQTCPTSPAEKHRSTLWIEHTKRMGFHFRWKTASNLLHSFLIRNRLAPPQQPTKWVLLLMPRPIQEISRHRPFMTQRRKRRQELLSTEITAIWMNTTASHSCRIL